MQTSPHFLILGAGSWGTALAVIINRSGNDVTLWTRNDYVHEVITDKRVNDTYLPDVFIDPDIKVSMNLKAACQEATHILIAVPSQQVRPMCINLSDVIARHVPIIIASKGIECGSLMLMQEVVSAILPHNETMVLSGPNFAIEAANMLPTATSLAAQSRLHAERVISAIAGRCFRPYYTDDAIGVQIGGALKNVIAIACGIAVGKAMGENARAALMTRGVVEMQRLAKVRGGNPETLNGLSGLGDLVLTCGSQTSRNMSLGMAIGRGEPVRQLLSANQTGLTEGVMTAESVYQISRKLGVSMPICHTVYDILHGNKEVEPAIEALLSRPLTEE